MRKILLLLLLAGVAANLNAAVLEGTAGGGGFAKPAVLPNTQLRVHDVGKVWLSVTNFGFFGSQDGAYEDASGKYLVAPGCEFPGGTNLNYLFQGALWIGATTDTTDNFGRPALDTLVSIGNDGWWGQLFEMFPDIPPGGVIKVRSTRPSDVYPYGDTIGAKSEQDYIAVYTDTFTTPSFVNPDPNDQRNHIPLYLRITQRSYAWSYEYAEDFVLFDFDIANIGRDTLKDLWVAQYIDADVYHTSENPYGQEQGAQDDICGFDSVFLMIDGRDTTRSHINTAWIADNDGQPYDGAYDYRSPTGVSGVRVVRTPLPDTSLQVGFNWWISNTESAKDWGPQHSDTSVVFPGGGMGTPGGDKAKYHVMSNREFDFDQIWCDRDHPGWNPRPSTSSDLANGYDTRYLFSFGPFPRIYPGDTLKLTTAYICGQDFHADPSNYANTLGSSGGTADSVKIQTYYDKLNFLDFATNSQWADWVYDNPGVDTDGNGYRGVPRLNAQGDTIGWLKGDGVPDFAGPPPPPSPTLWAITRPDTITIFWDGKRTEKFEDTFSRKVDFEGYRIYKSVTGRSDDYTLLADYDIEDYDFTWFDTTRSPAEWAIWKNAPVKRYEFPADWEASHDTSVAISVDPTDTRTGHWVAHGWNSGLDRIIAHPGANDTTYTYTLANISRAQGLYFAVTAYDYGDPITKLSPLESSPSINAKLLYPIAQGAEVKKVSVYPNPYRLKDALKPGGYLDLGWEDKDRSGNTNFDRRIMFAGLPQKWVIRIFTLDGDLVKQINEGDRPYQVSEGVAYWDLISRNTQAVVSGIYIYLIEGANGYHELGKLAIIK